MSGLFKDRSQAVNCNADAARDAFLLAAKLKERGDVRGMREALAWALECDKTATEFADGDNDDVLEEYR